MATTIKAQCLQIESILVDACNAVPPCPVGATEGQNEMVLFKVGTTPLTIAYTTTVSAILTPSWPNNPFRGWQTPGAITNPLVAALNSTIVKCGYLKEPVAGILPANSDVLIITSTAMCTAGNSFANLTDTLYVIFQIAGNTAGHFANNDNTGTITTTPTGSVSVRTLTLTYTGSSPCTESVSYDRSLLVNIFGTYGGTTTDNDGSTVEYDAAGNPTYVDNGCQAPYIPIQLTSSAPASVCSNATAIISGTISGPATSYSWTTSGTGTVSISTGTLSGTGTSTVNTVYTPSSGETGTVTFTLTATGKCSLAVVTNTVAITINPAPTPTISSSNGTSICNGNSTVLSVNNQSGTTYTWSPGGSTATSITVTPTNTATPTVYTISASSSCGTTQATYTVTVNPLPIITIPNDSICKGTTGTLTASGATTYTWNTGTTGATFTVANVTSNATYTVTGTNAATCTSTAVGNNIVRNNPVITVNNPTICSGSTATLTATGASTYTWSTSATTSSIIVTPTVSTTYSVTGTDANGCSNTTPTTVTVTVSSSSTVTVTPTKPIACSGITDTLNALGASTYTWVASDGTSIPNNGSQIIVTQTASVTYTVTGSLGGGCSSTSPATITITIAPPIAINIASSPTNAAVCQGNSITLTASGASTYTWTPSIVNGVGFTPSSSQTYSVTSTDANGCTGTATQSITVNNNPTLTVNSPTICAGSTATLTASGVNTYTWSTGSSTATTTVNPTATQSYTVTGTDVNGCMGITTSTVGINALPIITIPNDSICPGATGILTASGANTYTWNTSATGATFTVANVNNSVTYTVIGTNTTSTCTNTSIGNIIVRNPPTIAVNSPTICAGATTTLTASGANTYTWNTGSLAATTTVNPTVMTSYTVTGADINSCTATATATVNVYIAPIITINTTSSSICLGQGSATLTASGANTYTWSTSATSASITVSPSVNQTTYSVIGTDANGCVSSAAATTTITVNTPIPITISSSSGATVCAGATTTLTASGAQTYTWNNGTTFNTNAVSPTINPTTYSVNGTDMNGCKDSNTVSISVNPLPIAQSVRDTFVCKGGTTTLTETNSSYTYSWTGPAPSSATVSTNSSVNITQGGIYTLHTINSCGDIPTTFLVTKDSLRPSFVASPLTGIVPVSVSFTNTSIGNSLTYSWQFGDGNNSSLTNPTENYTNAGIFQAILTATDNLGCKDTASIKIIVNEIPIVLVIPNIFTPNGDNINDMFFITATGISNLDCKVYDRWGLLLHEWTGVGGGWDGKAKNGNNCTDGVYFYLISYDDNAGKLSKKDGFFELIR
ncbi:MAG: T9SS type B sorting domain-containing protein [Bacteroidia bacterium]